MTVAVSDERRTTIGRVRLHRAPGGGMRTDPIAARLRVTRLLEGLDLCPSGLPSGGVVIVRHARLKLSWRDGRLDGWAT
jgi:hypothetical protein